LTVDLREIKELIGLMKKNDLSVFKMEKEGFKITLKKGGDQIQTFIAPAAAVPAPAPMAQPGAPAAVPAAPAAEPAAGPVKEIASPMVGTFYRAASPEAAVFVEVGQEIAPGAVVCIIEAMKVMNEIKAEIGGTITEILAENGKPVQYGQALFRLK
jgi:acetyl-CoA carboxylase biotin carboxyl carrier protein